MASSLSRTLSRLASVRLSWSSRRFTTMNFPEPFQPLPDRFPVRVSADEAVSSINSGDKVYVHAVAATPAPLLDALFRRAVKEKLEDVTLYHLHLDGHAPWGDPVYEGKMLRSTCFHISQNLRTAVNQGRADYMPVFLSEIPLLFKRRLIELDHALVQVSPPDAQGYCSLGCSIDCTRAAVKNARHLIGLVNTEMIRTFGDGAIHVSHFDSLVETSFPLPEFTFEETREDAVNEIGRVVAHNLVSDGATLQFGIGTVPQAVLPHLNDHRYLGIHTEQFTDSIIELIEMGVVTNSRKAIHPGKVVATFMIGTKRVYDYVHDNPLFIMCGSDMTNDQQVIRQNPRVTSINSAIEVDLTGQVVADSIGEIFYSGFGGQIDFVRGATLCNDGLGKAVICLTSTAGNGDSKIVPYIKKGSGVVTTRAHVNYVVTEYGIAQLFGKNFRQRAYELIRIAHPDFREQLEKATFERFGYMPSSD